MDFNAPDIDYGGLSPIIALTGGLVLTLLAGLVGGSRRRQLIVVSFFGLGTLAAAAGLLIWQWGAHANLVAGALRLDDLAIASSLIAIASAAFCIPLSWREQAFDRPLGPSNHGEFQALVICSVLGMTMIAQAQNLISFFVAL
jgi:NADH-quinone oxidoreductase subunit N